MLDGIMSKQQGWEKVRHKNRFSFKFKRWKFELNRSHPTRCLTGI